MVKYILLIVCSLGLHALSAQESNTVGAKAVESKPKEYTLKRATGKLILHLQSVTMEGYDGKEIIFTSTTKEAEEDPKAAGLQKINNAGFRDNTGLGISVVEKGNDIEVNEVTENIHIAIRVPKDLIIYYTCTKITGDAPVVCRNMSNEIEIATEDNKIQMDQVSGPVTVRATYGSIDIVFAKQPKGMVHIMSVHAPIDVAMPADTKAEITLINTHNAVFVSPEFKIDVVQLENKDIAAYTTRILGKLNGGGEELRLGSVYGKVYFRKTLK